MEAFTTVIKNIIVQRIKSNKSWFNEFGSTQKMLNRYHYQDLEDYKVEFVKKDKVYFKIVPSYFSFPGGSYFWKCYDGEIENNCVLFYY